MLKSSILLLLLAPALAWAECGFVRSDGTLTILVGKNTSQCFGSSGFREAFIADITAALADDPEPAPCRARRAIDYRGSRGQRLWALEERAFQSRQPSGPYFGQKR